METKFYDHEDQVDTETKCFIMKNEELFHTFHGRIEMITSI